MFKKNFMARIIAVCSIPLILCGCSNPAQISPEADKSDTSGDIVPVADFSSLPFHFETIDWLFPSQSMLYYGKKLWDKANNLSENTIYQWDGTQTNRILEQTEQNNTILCTFADVEENIYLFGYTQEASVISYYLKKYNRNGELLWESRPDSAVIGILDGSYMQGGAADRKGQICLYDYYGKLYLFDETGNFRQTLDIQAENQCRLVQTKKDTIYIYYFDKNKSTFSDQLIYYHVDLANSSVSQRMSFTPERGFSIQTLWPGPEDSVFFSDTDTLWKMQLDNGVVSNILNWNDEYINIDSSQIQTMNQLENGHLIAYLYDDANKISEYAIISYQNKNTLPQKETITIGITKDILTDKLDPLIKRFNRQNKQWRVETVEYFSYTKPNDNYLDDFTLDVLEGNAPDILDARAIPMDLLDGSGIFENLEPYFQKSNIVNKEDLLESVWRAGQQNEKMTLIMPWFTVESCAIKKDVLKDRTWNLDTFIAFLNASPEPEMLDYISGSKRRILLEFALEANKDSFYDMDAKKCFFTDDKFKALLESIKQVEEKEEVNSERYFSESYNRFLNGEILIYQTYYANMAFYMQTAEAVGDTVSWLGYPSDQETYHLFRSFITLGINCYSEKKDGAWAFLEYLLSTEAQNLFCKNSFSFPVRKETFTSYIQTTPLKDEYGNTIRYATAEECEQLQQIVNHAYLSPYRIFDPINNIIFEECNDYFQDEKNVEEVTLIIQNRVQLYLDE